MQIDGINSVALSQGGAGVSKAEAPAVKEQEPYNPIMDNDQFTITRKKPEINFKALAGKVLIGSAIGAGVMVLSGGSALAALGLSTAIGAGLGAVKGLASAFVGSINFGGHSGSSSALDRNPIFGAILHGGLGLVKGAIRGGVLGALAATGFGPIGGAVAGGVLPVVGEAAKPFLRIR